MEEDAAIEAEAEARAAAAAPPPKRRGGGRHGGRGRGGRGYRSSDDDGPTSSEEESSSEEEEEEEEEEEGAGGTQQQRSGGASASAPAPALDARAAAAAAARALIARRRACAEAHAELECLLALAALDAQCPLIADASVYLSSAPYAAFLQALEDATPLASNPPTTASSPAAVAAAAISAEVCGRARAFDDALADALNELVNEWGMSRARMAALLGCPHAGGVPFERMRINDTLCVPPSLHRLHAATLLCADRACLCATAAAGTVLRSCCTARCARRAAARMRRLMRCFRWTPPSTD
jgi:hypothetical protein